MNNFHNYDLTNPLAQQNDSPPVKDVEEKGV